MADQALVAFTSVLESIPAWIADLDNILKTATERQNEVLYERQPVDSGHDLPRKPSKSTSLRSPHPEKDVQPEKQPASLLLQQKQHLTTSDALRLSQRKRKTASVCSVNQSGGPSKYRSRSVVVVYYDGDVQKRFNVIVRAIGTCRNAIRKGKMSAKVDSLPRTGSTSSEVSSSGGEEAELDLEKQPSYRLLRRRRSEVRLFGKDGINEFDQVDGCLDKSQTLCERAAHQVLRDGDCGLELNKAKEHFAEAQRLAKAGIAAVKKKRDKAVQCRRSAEHRRTPESAQTEQAHAHDVKIVHLPVLLGTSLEVDLDGDETEDGVGLSVDIFQLNRYQMRSSRLLAH